MTFPVVASVSTQNGLAVSSGSDISVTLPSGVTSGDLVVVVVAVDGGSTTSVAFGTLSNGWAKTTNEATSGVAGGVFWKYADGTDALDIPFTASGPEIFSYVAYRITGAHGTTDPEIVNLGSSSASANPDPPNLSLSGWSTEDTLWMAASTHDHGQWYVSTWPTNYSSNQYTARNNLTTGATTAVATRELAASSENPNAFTITASDTWIAWTIAVRPAAGGGSATVTPSIIASTATTGSHTVARTALAAVTASRIESTAGIGSHTVSAASVAAVTATRIASTVTFGTATVARTAVAAVSPTRIASTATIGSHAVAAAGMGAVSAPRIASTVSFGTHTAARTAVAALSPAKIDGTASFGAHTAARSAVASITPGRIDSSAALGIPAVSSNSTAQIVVGRIESTVLVRSPAVARTGASETADPAAVWAYVMSNGQTAEANVLAIRTLLESVPATAIADAVWAKVLP